MAGKKKLDMEALKNAFSNDKGNGGKGGGSGKYYNFFNMDFDDSCSVRFLPDLNEDNPLQFLVEKKSHRLEINGKNENIPCLSMYGVECPICETSKAYYSEGNKDEGKKYYRKVQHIGQVLVRKDPMVDEEGKSLEGEVKAISISWQVYKILQQSIVDGELEAYPYDFDEGTDFLIKKTKNGQWAEYSVGTKFARRESALSTEEQEHAAEHMVDLSTFLPEEPKLEIVEAKLAAALNGTSYNDSNSDEEEEEEEVKIKTKKRSVAKDDDSDEDDSDEEMDAAEDAADAAEDNDDSDDDGDEENSVLATIRKRRKEQKG